MTEIKEYHAPKWQDHIMGPSSGKEPFFKFEEISEEIDAVNGALKALVSVGILPESSYDQNAYDRFCLGITKSNLEIPWTGISPRMRRLIFSINAIQKPQNVACAGIFCGYTFICNAGASIGDGSCYKSTRLYGLELLPQEAQRARENIKRYAPNYQDSIVCADAVDWIENTCDFEIDLLYIDAKSIDFDPNTQDKSPKSQHSEYLQIIEAAYSKLSQGSLILAHNSVNAYHEIKDYLDFVRSDRFSSSINLIIDDAGLEVTKKL